MRIPIENIKSGKPFFIFDIIVYVFVLALAVTAIILIFKPQGSYVKVTVSGEVVDEFDLFQTIDKTYELKTGKMRLIISDGKVWIEESTCPEHICKHIGKISKAGEKIICIPNSMIIEVTGESEVETIT